MFCILGAHWHKILEFVPSCPIYGWLAWWCDYFPVGPTFEDHLHVFSQKRSSPLEFIFDTCASASSSHLFWLVKLNICDCSLLLGQMYFQQKNMCFAFWARVDTKFLNLSHPLLSMDGWPGDATFPLWGQPLKIIRMYSAKKRSSPLDFIFDTCASPSSSHLFAWWSWTYVVVDFFKDTCIFKKKVLNFGRALTQNYWICPILSYLWVVGLVMRLFSCGANLWRSSAYIQPKKVQPLGIYFWHLRLGLFRSPFWLVKLNICGCSLLLGQIYFQQKKHAFCILSACWHKILEFVPSFPIYGWLAWWCDFSSCGANLWRSCACIQPKKGPAPWNLFLTPAPRPLQVTFFGWWSWTYVVVDFFKDTCIFNKKTFVLQIWARVQDQCTPLQGQMYLWNLFLMSNLRTFSIIIIIAPFSQI